ncbi:hypothetical protein E4T56_gene12554 [Termitomyces sp. T112]|nr:hypothetical protein E4T56_gene12554 [Termitomyces sp. T112]
MIQLILLVIADSCQPLDKFPVIRSTYRNTEVCVVDWFKSIRHGGLVGNSLERWHRRPYIISLDIQALPLLVSRT